MANRAGIDGHGRIGRRTLLAIHEPRPDNEIALVAFGAAGDLKTNAHLRRQDAAHGRFARLLETAGWSDTANSDERVGKTARP